MAENKTTENNSSISDYLETILHEQRRKDCAAIIKLIAKHTCLKPKMWGTGIVGFGSYHYKYESGREGDAPLTALAARANSIVLYVGGKDEALLKQLGKYKKSGGCIHIKALADIDTKVMLKLAENSVEYNKKMYPG